ncbi:bZIP transcription factor [Hirsutella rhossiliensis]|uniref:BZIP transcription factor domain-containing protein n=1 Tax=Hirsutella rhossiliensis TaxID=111463 RepID=A0A9P8N5M5_9HYPO|nr:bZIP transcription factor domain-containing protein [Hirsutella rhossiliensis]KAH0966401.1 bZIP transcription factor domain-containing protein [Hirsutella rhossiliensis]
MSAPNQSNVDLDALLDLSEYDNNYNSPSLSPSSSKPTFASPVSAVVTTPSIPSTTPQTLSGPSHNYDMYRQQTGFVPGAIANTMAVNQTNNTGYQDFGSLEYMSNLTPENDMFDFNTSPAQSNMEIDFESPAESHQLFNTVNPSNIEQDAPSKRSPPVPSTSGSVGRLWPGAHSQAALAKAQAQQRQQHTIQQQQAQRAGAQQQRSRAKAPHPTDPIVEQKITQLLNSMRAKSSTHDAQGQAAVTNLPRIRKDEEDMDEDERLLASEEGKKLSSKERRQLRNKVSARAFRSRRKEYITQLESEIACKVNENGDLRARNRALEEENRQLSDLTRMLLGSPSFSTLLEHLSTNPAAAPQAAQVKLEPQQQAQEMSHIRKDVNPHAGQHSQQQQIGMAMVPEQSMDFSMLSLDNGAAYNFQPQVFVVDTPEMPSAVDVSVLSGKARDFVEETFLSGEDSKIEVPALERPAESAEASEPVVESPVDEEFECDPEFALFHSEPASVRQEYDAFDAESLGSPDIFGGFETEKMLSRYELVDADKENATATLAMARVQRMSANMESVVSRLELLTMDL